MLLQDWSYDRGQLTYMRELGEGHFGKVLLMIAKVCTQSQNCWLVYMHRLHKLVLIVLLEYISLLILVAGYS